jgi:2'-5' RNA ligase
LTDVNTSGTIRAFIAVDAVQSQSISEVLNEIHNSGAHVRVVTPAELHITLKFLGDISEKIIPKIETAMMNAVIDTKKFYGKLHGMGAFPGMSRINVIWVGVNDADALGRIATILDDSISALGVQRESRAFHPHITLARVKSPQNLEELIRIISKYKDRDFGDFLVEKIILKRSILTPQGPHYSAIAEVGFK